MSLFSREPLTALASFHLPPTNEVQPGIPERSIGPLYRLFPDSSPGDVTPGPTFPDFIGQIAQMKSLFRTSCACADEDTSILLHKVGQYVIVDQGPTRQPCRATISDKELPLTLVPFIAIEKYLGLDKPPLKGAENLAELADEPPLRTVVKNTFIAIEEESAEEEGRPQSCPVRRPRNRNRKRHLPPVRHPTLDELVVAQPRSRARPTPLDAIILSLSKQNTRLPPTPSRFGRAVEWRFGDFVILLGCDMTVYASKRSDYADYRNFCSFKVLNNDACSPQRRMDNWLENLMCNIPSTVWYDNDDHSMYVERTEDLPDQSFDASYIMDQTHRLFHFLKQELQSDCGTYWLFRESNSSRVDLYDISKTCSETGEEPCTDELRLPIASLCFRLARKSPDPIPLLRKGLRLLEPMKEDHSSIYIYASLELAALLGCDTQTDIGPAKKHLVVQLKAVESAISLDLEARDSTVIQRAYVMYAEAILKIVREVLEPLYSYALHTDWDTASKQEVSVAGLLNRVAWLSLANAVLDQLPLSQRQVEAPLLVSGVLESLGDAAFALASYPAEVHKRVNCSMQASASFLCERLSSLTHESSVAGFESVSDALDILRSLKSPFQRKVCTLDRWLASQPICTASWDDGPAMFIAVKNFYEDAYFAQGRSTEKSKEAKIRVGRKIAHVANEEARKQTCLDSALDYYNQALSFMKDNKDIENTAVVLVNMANIYFQKFLSSRDYMDAELGLNCVQAAWDDCRIGQRDLAYYHMRLGVALSDQECLAKTHLAKALKNFHTAQDKREVAVCHFHLAELLRRDVSDAEISIGTRHACKSFEFWTTEMGAYPNETIQGAIQVAHFHKASGKVIAALKVLASTERQLLKYDEVRPHWNTEGTTVPALRTVMGKLCQEGLKEGICSKELYRKILRNEAVDIT